MEPSKLVRTFTDAELLARHHRKRRWAIRIAFVSLLAISGLGLILFIFTCSGLTIEEAKVLYKKLGNQITEVEAEDLLGKSYTLRQGIKVWFYTKHHLNDTDWYAIYISCKDDGLKHLFGFAEGNCSGWHSWKFRWDLLKIRFGFKVD